VARADELRAPSCQIVSITHKHTRDISASRGRRLGGAGQSWPVGNSASETAQKRDLCQTKTEEQRVKSEEQREEQRDQTGHLDDHRDGRSQFARGHFVCVCLCLAKRKGCTANLSGSCSSFVKMPERERRRKNSGKASSGKSTTGTPVHKCGRIYSLSIYQSGIVCLDLFRLASLAEFHLVACQLPVASCKQPTSSQLH